MKAMCVTYTVMLQRHKKEFRYIITLLSMGYNLFRCIIMIVRYNLSQNSKNVNFNNNPPKIDTLHFEMT